MSHGRSWFRAGLVLELEIWLEIVVKQQFVSLLLFVTPSM